MADGSRCTLDEALKSTEVLQGEEAGFWKFVDREGDVVYFEVTAWTRDVYLLQLTADKFQDEPMLGRFVDFRTRACTADAWPRGTNKLAEWIKWEAGNLFICWPGDRGGIGHHSEWREQRYWNKTPNPLHQYLEFIRKCLRIRANGYQPRSSRAA